MNAYEVTATTVTFIVEAETADDAYDQVVDTLGEVALDWGSVFVD